MRKKVLTGLLAGTILLANGTNALAGVREFGSISFERPEVAEAEAAEKETAYIFTDEEKQILMTIAVAEAEDQGVMGQAMVMRVILNRVNDYRFPNTIEAVVFQPYQFSPVSNGRYYRVSPNAESQAAFQMIEDGWDETYGALYFCEGWFPWCEYVTSYASHNFFR